MIFGSVCSGIDAASVAWTPLGMTCAWMSEVEAFPRAVLKHRHSVFDARLTRPAGSQTALFGDFTTMRPRMARRFRPRWLVWENVPGVLSSNAAVLFEPACLRGNPAPRRKARQRPAPPLAARANGGGGLGTDHDLDGGLISAADLAPPITSNQYGDHESRDGLLVAFGGNNTSGPIDVAAALLAQPGSGWKGDFESETFITHALTGEGFDASEDGTGRGTPIVPVAYRTSPNCGAWDTGDRIDALTTGTDRTSHVVAFDTTQITSRQNRSNPQPGDPCHPIAASADTPAIAFSGKDYGADAGALAPTLRAMGHTGSHANGGGQIAIQTASAVRRLTPRECERLQGFPDDFTAIPWKGRDPADCPDGPRYKALGNSMAVPVMAWIGRRILAVDAAGRESLA